MESSRIKFESPPDKFDFLAYSSVCKGLGSQSNFLIFINYFWKVRGVSRIFRAFCHARNQWISNMFTITTAAVTFTSFKEPMG